MQSFARRRWMMLDLGRLYPSDWSGIPPHMSSRDFLIWRAWHEKNWAQWMGFYFDVAVGTPVEAPSGLEPKKAAAMQRISLKRLDALGVKKDRYTVIEVRPAASSSPAGAVLLYRYLLLLEAKLPLPIDQLIVTDQSDPDSRKFFEHQGIEVVEVGPVLLGVEFARA
jgi:hypothetical protein